MPNEITDEIVIEARLKQDIKALPPTVVIDDGSVIEVKPVLLKAVAPMLVTERGMLIVFRPRQPLLVPSLTV